MKTKDHTPSVVYQNSEVEQLLPRDVAVIEKEVQTFANDLAQKNLPGISDKLKTYIAKIRSPFQNLLEKIHKKIGAIGINSEIESLRENYEKEEENLENELQKIEQELRLTKKQEKEFKTNVTGNESKNWRYAFIGIGILTLTEVIINFKIFLPLSSNTGTALALAGGIGLSFAVICHVFKDVLDLFTTRTAKIITAVSIIGFVVALLYSFARLRLSMIDEMGEVSTQHLSETNFVLINLVLLLSGMALTLYKPSKKVIADNRKKKKLTQAIGALQDAYDATEKRLAVLTEEKNTKLDQLRGIVLMAHHYERIVVSEYERVFALWCSEGMIARRNDEMPACYSEDPEPLKTYFDEVNIQNP
jgi:predicted  nucleic acid-binding Zn-ribbon protein